MNPAKAIALAIVFLISAVSSGINVEAANDARTDTDTGYLSEKWHTGLGTGIDVILGSSAGSTIEYTPNMLPDGMTARLAFSPKADAANAADKGSTSNYTQMKSGYDVVVSLSDAMHGITGLTVDAGYSKIDQDQAVGNYNDDKTEETIGLTYAMGGFTVGYQWSEADLGTTTGAQQYDNDGYGITFAINDDLSIGYNHYESEQTNTTNVTSEATSVQIAYSMGGASVRLASSEAENMDYQTGADYDRDSTTLSVALAF
mgnify:CR=1 FL=1